MRVEQVSIQWNPELPIHASEAYLRALCDSYGWIGGFDASGRQCCAVAYTVLQKPFIRMVRFRSGVIPFVDDFRVEDEKEFLNGVVRFACSAMGNMIIPAANNVLFQAYPDGATVAPYGSFVIDLSQSEEALWDNLHSKHRNVVRNATKKGVTIKSGKEHLDQVYTMVRDTLARSSLSFMSAEQFKRLVEALGSNVKLLVAEHQGVVQGAAMIPFSKYGAYYVYGGSVAEPLSGAMNLLHWEAIKLFRNLGVRRYDFVGVRIHPEKGSKQDGLMMFKGRFGGELKKGYMWKYADPGIRHWAYSLGVRILKGGDIVDQEKHKLEQAVSSQEA